MSYQNRELHEGNPEGLEFVDDLNTEPSRQIGRFLLRKLEELEVTMEQRYGYNYSSIDVVRSPDILAKGIVLFGVYIITSLPELSIIYIYELSRGVYDLIKRTNVSKK